MNNKLITDHGNFIITPKGCFIMGNQKKFTSYFGNERIEREQARKEHAIKITNDIAVLETPVTVSQYNLFLKDTNKDTDQIYFSYLYNKEELSWYFKSDKSEKEFKLVWHKKRLIEYLSLDSYLHYPVVGISYFDCLEYCQWLTSVFNLRVRLLSEAEWEFCCKAKNNDVFFWGNKIEEVNKYSWFCLNSRLNIQETKRLHPNPWGFYDITGNVWEWCSDIYSEQYYNYISAENPICDLQDRQVFSIRGGSAFNKAETCRSSHRFGLKPETRSEYLGFRILIELS